jgi:5-methylcytosine-specific restriction endonuclease McrA
MALLCSIGYAGNSGHSSGRHSSTRSKSSKPSKSKSVHVREYTRKDGTVVHSHYRSAPGTATTYTRNHAAAGYSLHPSVRRDFHGRIKRSAAAKNEFKHSHPCPSTGKPTGGCPGYVVDHVTPLECGGADAASNMQWQTVAEGKAKDKTERYCR